MFSVKTNAVDERTVNSDTKTRAAELNMVEPSSHTGILTSDVHLCARLHSVSAHEGVLPALFSVFCLFKCTVSQQNLPALTFLTVT